MNILQYFTPKQIKEFFTPFAKLDKTKKTVMSITQLLIILAIWQLVDITFLPKPLDILSEILRMIREESLLAELWVSTKLCIESMSIAIFLSAIISYSSTIPAFRNIALFISNGRFLSLFGLSFFFTLLTPSAEWLKISLLVFSVVVFFTNSFIDAIDKIDYSKYTLARTLGMDEYKTLWYVVIRGMLSTLIEISSQCFAIAWMMLASIENLVKSGGGISVLLVNENKYLHIAGVLGIQLIIFGVGMGFVYLIKQLRYMICPETKFEGVN